MNTTQVKWPLLWKAAFLFLFVYIFIYANSTQFGLSFLFSMLWKLIVPSFAELLGHPEPVAMKITGSGDTTFDYYSVLLFAVLSVIIATSIALFDRKRANYQKLLPWLTLLVRYYLAVQMINYGLAKIYYLQFSFPHPIRLDQPLGEFSPMGLLWTFMGYSKGYTIFTGILEAIGGLFLLSRNTTTLGALTSFGVMLNVMMLNFCYDVPVKLLSTHLVLFAVFLIALDGKRLFRFFISNQPAVPHILAPIYKASDAKILNKVKWAVVFTYLAFMIFSMENTRGDYTEKPEFYGKYTVERFDMIRDTLPLRIADEDKWATFYQKNKGRISVKMIDGITRHLKLEVDTSTQHFKVKDSSDTSFYELRYQAIDSVRYQVQGKYWNQDSLIMVLRKEDLNQHLLVNRGFHWINEYPFNQ